MSKAKGAPAQAPPPAEEEVITFQNGCLLRVQVEVEENKVPESGVGRFEFQNGTLYTGNWKLVNGVKCKHGAGKLIHPGAANAELGAEEYDGEWEDDKMHGQSTFLNISRQG